MSKLFVILSLILLIVLALWTWKDYNREWRYYQRTFSALENESSNSVKEKKSGNRYEIKQIDLPKLNRTDRCVTCHLGVDDPTMVKVKPPYKVHPNFSQHPFNEFGCTICHLGQGRATTLKAAHGEVRYWEEPKLPLKYIQASCAKCHLISNPSVAPDLVQGMEKYKEYECANCHIVNGVGEKGGIDLSLAGKHRSPDWHFAHLKDSQALVPDSQMPNFGLTDEEARVLTVYLLSLRKEEIPSRYLFPSPKK
ncbi:MAG: c-type cytochrome [candidate division Zixibacteria bacterium]|nr:c-type cytochrome [candidate division Zixibacteria bacterium]